MKTKLLAFFKHQLIVSSLVMMGGTFVANVGNYLYHLLMGRMLGPEKYGELESVISLLYLLFIAVNTLALVITKFTAQLKGKKDRRGIVFLLAFFSRLLLKVGIGVTLCLFLLSPRLASWLHLGSKVALLIICLHFLVATLVMVKRAVLQGLLCFKSLVSIHIVETGFKVIVATALVWLGLGVNGATLALLLAGLLVYFLTDYFLGSLKDISPRKPSLRKKTLFKFALPVLASNLSFTSLYTTDILLVKHFFPAHQAGLYASLSVLGKIVFFANSAVVNVMFPMVAERRSQGVGYRKLFLFSFSLVALVCAGILVVYQLFPELMVTLLFGNEYLTIAPLLVWMGLFISFYSLSFLLTNFFLSADQAKAVVLPLLAAGAQIFLISFFHPSLLAVIKISLSVSGLLFLALLVYFAYGQKEN